MGSPDRLCPGHGLAISAESTRGARDESLIRWAARVLDAHDDSTWVLREEGYAPVRERSVESRFAVSNGFLGLRASIEQPTRDSAPRTYVAGFFDTSSKDQVGPRLISGPDWLRLHLVVDGERVGLDAGETLSHCRALHLCCGLLVRDWRQRLPSGKVVRLRTARFASLVNRPVAGHLTLIEVDRPAQLILECQLAGATEDLLLVQRDGELTSWRTAAAGRRLAVASSHALHLTGRSWPDRGVGDSKERRWEWQMRPRQQALHCQVIAVAREDNDGDPDREARAASRWLRAKDVPALLEKHARAWERRWTASDVVIEGDPAAQEEMRFALYHLIAAANPHDERVSIPARALTGDAYMGHVFWDTEVFLLPFYTFTWPEAARALLMYRYHTLPAARDKAVQFGCQGALYAWESAETGQEVTPTFDIRGDGHVVLIRCGMEEHHISADIAYAVWQYWQATRDVGFLLEAGAEIVLETARFWASRAMPEEDGRYHIRGVIGPDEYHEGVDDNAYTNFMARWNLECGQQVAQLLQTRWPQRWAELREKLNISLDDLGLWHEVAAQLAIDRDPATGLLEQFTGFFQLEPVDLAAYEPRLAAMDVLLGRERTQRSQVIKQADVVMLLALHWDRFAPEVREANFRFYEGRCDHGSSLSPAMHALVAARLGDVALAERYFHEAAAIDLHDAMGNAAGGVHIAALGGLWQVAVFGFGGMRTEPGGLAFDPHLPEGWTAMRFPIRWRRRVILVCIERDPLTLTVTLEHGRPFAVRIGNVKHTLRRGETWTCRADPLIGGWKEGT